MPTGLGGEVMWLCPSLDDSPNDLSGNGNNGTYVNGTATVADSDPSYNGSRAYNFDGSDDYINAGNQNAGGDSRSWSLWFKTNSTTLGSSFGLFSQRTYQQTGMNQYLGLDSSTASLIAQLDTHNAGPFNVYGTTRVDDSEWYHAVWRLDRSTNTLELYINGSMEGSVGSIAGSHTNGNDLSIGAGQGRTGAVSSFFPGRMDDIRMYNRPLEQSEITHLAISRGILGGPGGTHVHRTLLGVG
jgi:hypothetical protein